ncbi:MAG: M20/M25/M40 family metallo-hydrolase, partial [Anaerolineae bacterium]|nr:M20/M25/M40 family metallo-hydrolase [Anaerolineae bacterium]
MRLALLRIASACVPEKLERVKELLDAGQVEEAMTTAGLEEEDVARYRPLFYDTAAITGLRAGNPENINVIPPLATAYADGRILPGQTKEGFFQALQQRVGDEVEIQVYKNQYSAGVEANTEHPILETIQEVIGEHYPGAQVIPWLCIGATDAKYLLQLGTPVYGFIPAKPLPEGIEELGAHANDERIWIENVPFALEVLYEVAYRFCTRV